MENVVDLAIEEKVHEIALVDSPKVLDETHKVDNSGLADLHEEEEKKREIESQLDDLRKKLYDSECKRLELISSNNQESYELNLEIARLRKDLEKNEALRHSLENELTSVKTTQMKERILIQEKDRCLVEANRIVEGPILGEKKSFFFRK